MPVTVAVTLPVDVTATVTISVTVTVTVTTPMSKIHTACDQLCPGARYSQALTGPYAPCITASRAPPSA
eukprot:3074017-Rhodomonas_salina.1